MSILATAASNPTAVLLNYGAVGAMLIVLGYFAWGTIKRERDRADRLEQQLQVANDRIIDRLADSLKQAADALRDYNDYLRDLRHRDRP